MVDHLASIKYKDGIAAWFIDLFLAKVAITDSEIQEVKNQGKASYTFKMREYSREFSEEDLQKIDPISNQKFKVEDHVKILIELGPQSWEALEYMFKYSVFKKTTIGLDPFDSIEEFFNAMAVNEVSMLLTGTKVKNLKKEFQEMKKEREKGSAPAPRQAGRNITVSKGRKQKRK